MKGLNHALNSVHFGAAHKVCCAAGAVQLHFFLCCVGQLLPYPKSQSQKHDLVTTYPVNVHNVHFTYETSKNSSNEKSGASEQLSVLEWFSGTLTPEIFLKETGSHGSIREAIAHQQEVC